MKIAILSDIHGNNEAFRAVLEDIDNAKIEKMVCLGDCIGYGPEPETVIQEIRRRNIPNIIGNHEMAVGDSDHLNWFNPMARKSLERTIEMLSQDSLDYIKTLDYSLAIEGSRCVHGFPPDSARTYLFRISSHGLKTTLSTMPEPICFVGHTHDLEIIEYSGKNIERWPLKKAIQPLNRTYKYIINVGSVGQPRDGNNNAKYVIWDTQKNEIDVRYIPYDIASTVAKIKAAKLPESHANRLW